MIKFNDLLKEDDLYVKHLRSIQSIRIDHNQTKDLRVNDLSVFNTGEILQKLFKQNHEISDFNSCNIQTDKIKR